MKSKAMESQRYFLYMLFAVVCTGINIGSQALLKVWLSPIPELQTKIFHFSEIYFIIQLIVGTGLGFIAKFVLDKWIVFKNKHVNVASTFNQLIIYGLFAVLTTLIFWGFEIGFKLLFTFPHAELIGGIIGLGIGYTVKFFMDKSFVFKELK